MKFTALVCGKNDSNSDIDNYEVYFPWLLGNQNKKSNNHDLCIAPPVGNTSTATVAVFGFLYNNPFKSEIYCFVVRKK